MERVAVAERAPTAVGPLLPHQAALIIGAAVFASAADGSASQAYRRPSKTQLERLTQYEPFIEYFSSIGYGPAGSTVTPEYIRALILTESGAHRFAVSNKGAGGLTQIMPETGRLAVREIVASGLDFEYVDERRLTRYTPEVLYDPAINILIACYLGAIYHSDYSGRTDLVAAAWYAGQHAVARYGYRTPPYEETRGMVMRLVCFLNYFASTSTPSAKRPRSVPAVAARHTDPSHPSGGGSGARFAHSTCGSGFHAHCTPAARVPHAGVPNAARRAGGHSHHDAGGRMGLSF